MNMDRLLGISSSSSSSSTAGVDLGGDELNEDDILWTNDVAEQDERSFFITTTTTPSSINNSRPIFARKSGILAALSDTKQCEVLYRKPIIPVTRKMGTSIPRQPLPERESVSGSRKLLQQQSAPVNVPLLSIAAAKERKKKFLEMDYDEENDHEMLPPHEIVARGSGVSPKTTFSMLEGTGRTLKGRDLRRVRNAVWRKTGFLD